VVLVVSILDQRFYACGECGLIYTTKELAEACEKWCREHGSCNMSLAKQSIGSVRQASLRLGDPSVSVGPNQ